MPKNQCRMIPNIRSIISFASIKNFFLTNTDGWKSFMPSSVPNRQIGIIMR